MILCKTSKNPAICIVASNIQRVETIEQRKNGAHGPGKQGEMMGRMSEVPKEMAGTGGSHMSMDYHNKIEAMKKDWNPFDTYAKM